MEPLDLTIAPPRKPRAELAGIIFLPRSIDKVRASLPGGDLGDYTIVGLTTTMLDSLELSLAKFTEAVRTARSDGDVAAFVTANAKPGGVDVWHRFAHARQPRGGNVADAIESYPFLAGRSDLGLSLDVIEEDDRFSFARGSKA